MRTIIISIMISIVLILIFTTCKKKEINSAIINGIVTNSKTFEPVSGVSVSISPSEQSTSTDASGGFRFENLQPGTYILQYKNSQFETESKTVSAEGGLTTRADISLKPHIPLICVDKQTIDFSSDKTQLLFTISNCGKGILEWQITGTNSWLVVNPISGTLTDQPQIVTVNINKSGMTPGTYQTVLMIGSNGGMKSIMVSMIVLSPVPMAKLFVTPNSGTTNEEFFADASQSTDDNTPTVDLWVRWKWDAFTPFSSWTKTKTVFHKYTSTGKFVIQLEVKDKDGYIGQAEKEIEVLRPPWQCFDTINYDGQIYHTVLIGAQCWMKENLNIGLFKQFSQGVSNNMIIEKYCYNDDIALCNVYGGLYDWNELMQYSTYEGVKGICPEGWHIPSDADWTILSSFAGGNNTAGGNLKERGLTHWANPNMAALDLYGFTALPGGSYNNSWEMLTTNGFFWTSTKSSANAAKFVGMSHNDALLIRSSAVTLMPISIRCVKNSTQ